MVHRDVKPGNIILRPDGAAVLTDFGLACWAAGGDISGGSEVVGTPYYMAPEQCAAGRVDGRADLYGLGVTAYQALACRLPITGETPLQVLRGHVERTPQPLGEVAPGVSREMEAIVMRLLAKAPGGAVCVGRGAGWGAGRFRGRVRAVARLRAVGRG